MLRRLNGWVNQRWPLNRLLEGALTEEVAGGASFAYSMGSIVLFLLLLQALTGVFQLFYYVPTTDHAYDSLNYLRTQVPFGWLIHNLHYWGANAMVVMLCVHISRVYIWGAYQRPRELTWLLGVGLFFLTLGMTFTGAPLPWDELGYWAMEVGSSIAGTIPGIGLELKHLLRGGGTMSQLTLSRMFVVHVALLPGLLAALVAAHLVAFRTSGNAGPWREEQRKRTGPFWPDQLIRDMLAVCLVLLVLIGLAAFATPPFTGPADPIDTTYQPKPEWNFLFLYQMLKLFPGHLEVLGTAGIPLLGLLAMLAIPWLDRSPERSPRRRLAMMFLALLVAITVTAFTILGALSHPGGSPGHSASASGKRSAAPTDSVGTSAGPESRRPGEAASMIGNPPHGAEIFHQQCRSCHGARGAGEVPNPGSAAGKVPPLNPIDAGLYSDDPVVFARNIDLYIQHGSVPAGPHPVLQMLPFGDNQVLSQEEIAEVEAYILSLNGVNRAELIHPGLAPGRFFILALGVFSLVGIGAGLFWLRRD